MTGNAISTSIFRGYVGSGYPLDRGSWRFARGDFFHAAAKKPEPELLPPSGRGDCTAWKTFDEDRTGRDHHHLPPRQIHLSETEICLKKRSHPCNVGSMGRASMASRASLPTI
jgi:hypothetical protein